MSEQGTACTGEPGADGKRRVSASDAAVARRPEGRPGWRKDEDGFRGVIVAPDGRVAWRSAGVASMPRYALRDARHGGPHWSHDGRSNGYTAEMAWLPEADARAAAKARLDGMDLGATPPPLADPDVPF